MSSSGAPAWQTVMVCTLDSLFSNSKVAWSSIIVLWKMILCSFGFAPFGRLSSFCFLFFLDSTMLLPISVWRIVSWWQSLESEAFVDFYHKLSLKGTEQCLGHFFRRIDFYSKRRRSHIQFIVFRVGRKCQRNYNLRSKGISMRNEINVMVHFKPGKYMKGHRFGSCCNNSVSFFRVCLCHWLNTNTSFSRISMFTSWQITRTKLEHIFKTITKTVRYHPQMRG